MTEVTPSVAKQVLRTLIHARQPGFFWGPPGIGKSQIVAQVADELFAQDYPDIDLAKPGTRRPWLQDIRMILLDPVDLRGLPSVAQGITSWNAPDFLPTRGSGVLFLDELNRAPALVQNAGFQLILDRRLGDYELPDGWLVIGAGNREQDGGGVTRMSSALANRFIHIEVTADLNDWSTWAAGAGIEPVVIAFLRFRPALLHEFDRDSHAFPTPRSWSFVSNIVKTHPARDVELALVEGTVGHGAAVEFVSFVDLWRKLPNIDAILLDPKNATVPNQHDVGTMYAVTAALGSRSTAENFERVTTYLNRLPTEYAVFAVRDAVNRDQSLTSTPAFVDWAVKNQDVF